MPAVFRIVAFASLAALAAVVIAGLGIGAGGFVSVAFRASAAQTAGRSIFVDPAGDDSNDGASPAHPWRTIAKVNAAALGAGDTIRFKRGGLWRETLEPHGSGAAGRPITFTVYGSGRAPIISGADAVTGWTAFRDGARFSAALAKQPNNVYLDDLLDWGLGPAASPDAMQPGSWCWQAGTLYARLADGSNPAAHLIEAAVRPYGTHTVDKSYIVFDGLWVRRTAGWGVFFYSDTSPEQSTDIVIRNCIVTQTGTGTLDDGRYYNAIHVSRAAAPRYENNTISYSGGHGNAINSQLADGAVIAGNRADHFNHHGFDVKNSQSVLVRGNIAHDSNEANGIYCEHTRAMRVENNIVYNLTASASGRGSGVQIDDGSSDARIFNNSVFNVLTGIYLTVAGTVAMNNAISQARYALRTSAGGIFDYNDWGAGARIYFNGTEYNLGQWRALAGHDHDIGADPMWAGPQTGDFRLLPGSPCIGAATNTGTPFKSGSHDLGAKSP
jgi:hypothetical protein